MKRNERIWAMLMAVMVGISTISVPEMKVKAEEITQEYVVYTDASAETALEVCEDVLNETVELAEEATTPEEEELLQDADVAVVELTPAEAEEIESAEDVLVEENIVFAASGKKEGKKNKKVKKEKKKQNAEQEISTKEQEETENLDETLTEIEDEAVDSGEEFYAEASESIQQIAESKWNRKAVMGDVQIPEGNDIIKVAVLDSGVDVTDELDIEDRIDLVNEESVSYLCQDMTGHGTAVASVIGAKGADGTGVAGINENLEIYSVKILDENNCAPLSRVMAALQWCQENEIDVVNMSFGASVYSEIFEKAIQEAEQAGMLLIASAGNGETVEYPAAFKEVVAVGSVNADMQMAADCAKGEEVELLAPGEYVPVLSPLGTMTLGSGSSYAAPHVTAVAATLWNEMPDWDNRKIRALLNAGEKKILGETEEGLVDYAYTKSISGIFSETYRTEGEEYAEDAYINTDEAEFYDIPEYVKANWGDEKHADLVRMVKKEDTTLNTTFNEKKVTLLQQVSHFVDKNESIKATKTMHAAGDTNYVAVTKYLYDVAKAQKKSYKKSINEILAGMAAPAGITSGQLAKLQNAIVKVCETSKIGTVSIAANDSVKNAGRNRGLRVLGMALHVAGDAYAHKAIVPKSTDNKNRIKAGMTTAQWNTIKSKYNDGVLTTAGVSKACGDRGSFEDNPKFVKKRYDEGAKNATEKLLSAYVNNQPFTYDTFYKNGYTIKQYKLKTYMLAANGGADPFGGNVAWSKISVRD